ncbi:hypothetical protein [Microcystis aeruginosa]|uniref:hypothetical protein n=1 Tax=Microcystis aeruginosa TaxID=1126 RepID=UPI001882CFD3|nr:hypothetical protein [Microcystis aeruginosa]
MNDYSYLLYSEKSVLATDCYDVTPLNYEGRGNYEKRGILSAKNPTENGFLEETRFLGDLILLSRVHHNWRLLGSFEMNYDGIWHHPQTIS